MPCLGADRVLDFLIKLAKILQQGLQFPQHGWGEDCPTKPTSTTHHEARSSTVRGKDESEEVGSTVPLLTTYWCLNLLFICSDTDKHEIYKMYLCSQKIDKAIPKQIMRHRVEESQYCLPALRRPTVSLRSHRSHHRHELGSYARRVQRRMQCQTSFRVIWMVIRDFLIMTSAVNPTTSRLSSVPLPVHSTSVNETITPNRTITAHATT